MDRNDAVGADHHKRRLSLSARRAWIEIPQCYTGTTSAKVALRKESVDRNLKGVAGQDLYYVALRKESVDRNCRASSPPPRQCSRSPQGERG